MWPFLRKEPQETHWGLYWEQYDKDLVAYTEWANENFPIGSEVELGGVTGVVMSHERDYIRGYDVLTQHGVVVYFPATGNTQYFTPQQLGHPIKTPVEPY